MLKYGWIGQGTDFHNYLVRYEQVWSGEVSLGKVYIQCGISHNHSKWAMNAKGCSLAANLYFEYGCCDCHFIIKK